MKMMLQRALAILIVMAAATVAVPAAGSVVTYVFGDSLSEVGNNNFLQLSLAKSNYPFYGIDYSGGRPTGRFTNGRTIGDIISEKLGIPPPPPYLSLSLNNIAILRGVNYASGGAGILNETGLYFIQRLSFDDQINCFNKTAQAIRAKIGVEAANKQLNEAVYFIGIGSNDYVNNFLQPFLPDGQQYTHEEFLGLLISTLGDQFTRLHQLGARKMFFHGLGPLGCIPSQRIKSRRGQCLSRVNQWVSQFNARVKKLTATLNKHLQAADISFMDTYQAVLELITNPTGYEV